jgi:hypothetical protein
MHNLVAYSGSATSVSCFARVFRSARAFSAFSATTALASFTNSMDVLLADISIALLAASVPATIHAYELAYKTQMS